MADDEDDDCTLTICVVRAAVAATSDAFSAASVYAYAMFVCCSAVMAEVREDTCDDDGVVATEAVMRDTDDAMRDDDAPTDAPVVRCATVRASALILAVRSMTTMVGVRVMLDAGECVRGRDASRSIRSTAKSMRAPA